MNDPKVFRTKQLSALTDEIGVYALCDLDGLPIYIGQSTDGIRTRVRRHLTSARSDVIANRMIDVWEIAFVWAWLAPDLESIPVLEAFLFCHFDAQNTLMNGKMMPKPDKLPFDLPEKQVIQVINDETIKDRLDPQQRLPRQISQYLNLVDYILTVKDEVHLKRALQAHLERLTAYHERFLL